MNEARNNGVPLVMHAPKSKIQASFVGLMEALSGRKSAAARNQRDRAAGSAASVSRR